MSRKKVLLVVLLAVAVIVVIMSNLNSQAPSSRKLDYAQDFSWVQGRLELNPVEGGFWQIRFGSQNAPHDGKFVLGNDPKLYQFEDGDLVKITGEISPQQVSIFQAGTMYEIISIEKIAP